MSENKIQENIDGDVNMDSGVAEIRQEENSLKKPEITRQKTGDGEAKEGLASDWEFIGVEDTGIVQDSFHLVLNSMNFLQLLTETQKKYLSNAYKEHVLGASIMPEDIDWSDNIARFDFYVTKEDTDSKAYETDSHAIERLRERLGNIEACNGPKFQPLYCTPDGNCLPYAISRSLVGSEILYSAIRQQIVLEMSNNSEYYSQFCFGSIDLLKEWIAAAQKNEEYMEEIHTQALSNILKRPIAWFDEASNKLKNKLFLPTRFKRSDCLFQDTKQMPSIIAIGWGAPNHFISLVVEKNEKDIPIKSYSLNDSIKIYDKLSQLLQIIIELRNLETNLSELGITKEAIVHSLTLFDSTIKKFHAELHNYIETNVNTIRKGARFKRPAVDDLFYEFQLSYENDETNNDTNVNVYAFINLFSMFTAVVEDIPNIISIEVVELYALLHNVLVAEIENENDDDDDNNNNNNNTNSNSNSDNSNNNNNNKNNSKTPSIISGCIESQFEEDIFQQIFQKGEDSLTWDQAREEYGGEYNDNGTMKKGWFFGTGKDGWGSWLDEKKQMLTKNFHDATFDGLDEHAESDVNEHFESMVDGDLRIKYNCNVCRHQEIIRAGNPLRVSLKLSHIPCTKPNCLGNMLPWEGHENRSTLQTNFLAKLMGTFSDWKCRKCSYMNTKLHTTCAICHRYRVQPFEEKILKPIVLSMAENNDDESKKDGDTSTLLSTATTNEGKMTDSDDVKETPVITTSALIKKPGLRRQATDTTSTILNKSPKRFKRAHSLPETESEKEQLPEKFRNNKMLENFDLKLIKAVFFAQGGANIGDFISKMPSAKRRKRST